MSQFWPREDCPQKDKSKPEYYKQRLDYAEQLLKNYAGRRTAMDRNFQDYSGIKTDSAKALYERTYGKQNKTAWVSYNLGRTKLSLLHGERLKMPLSATVTTINSEAKSEKMRQLDFMTGAMIAKREIADLKEKAGVDVMEGAPVPQDENDPIWAKMSVKDKQEDIMQIILDEQIINLDAKQKLARCFLDVLICSMCYIKVEIDEQGEVELHHIDPRDAIFEEIEGDIYLGKSPVKGCRQRLPVHVILLRYNLSKEDRDKLDAARKNPSEFVNGAGRGWSSYNNGELLCDVIHIEWDSVEALYSKIIPKKKEQLDLDSTTTTYELDIDTEAYESNTERYNNDVKAGKYTTQTKYTTVKYEATRIGGCIDVNCRKKYFQARSMDDPSGVLNSSYHGFICGRVDGRSLSMQEIVHNFSNLFDIVQYQKNKDIARAKGKAIMFDMAGLPEKSTVKKMMYEWLNDGLITVNSAAAGNYSAKNINPSEMIKEIDSGLSQSFEQLLVCENNIINMLNQITGINENRQGDIAASSTATNANSSISASRSITEPIFFGMNGFVSKVLQTVVDSSAVSWAFYKTEKGEQILGTEKHKYLQVTKEIGYRDYGVHIEDGGKYMEIKQIMNRAMEASLNAKELRPIDYFNVNMAETMAQAKTILRNSWEEMQTAIQKSNEANNAVQQQMQQAQLQQQVDLAREDREDRQGQSLTEIDTKGNKQMQIDDNKMKGKMFETQLKNEHDILTSE